MYYAEVIVSYTAKCEIEQDTYTPPTNDFAGLELLERTLQVLGKLVASAQASVGLLACLELGLHPRVAIERALGGCVA